MLCFAFRRKLLKANLFPKRTVEILERHALEKYNMTELLTDPEVLRKLEPNKELLKTILELKHMMKGEVLTLARDIVRKVAEEIARKLEQEIRISFFGRINRNASSPVKSARNLDMRKTIRMNLKNYDQESRQIILKNGVMWLNRCGICVAMFRS